MLTVSNLLSLARGPLALLLFYKDIKVRATVIVLAMLTDGLDGFLARRFSSTTRLGAILDPLMDKFFVSIALLIFLTEGYLGWGELGAIVCRDIAVALFGLYLVVTKRLAKYKLQAIWAGKATTLLQFYALLRLTFYMPIPQWMTILFAILGGLALAELCVTYRLTKK